MDSDDSTLHLSYHVAYDNVDGVVRISDTFVREQIEVRKQLEESVLRTAVVAELRRLGYLVFPPTEETEGVHE